MARPFLQDQIPSRSENPKVAVEFTPRIGSSRLPSRVATAEILENLTT
jgi:hypothetical protein